MSITYGAAPGTVVTTGCTNQLTLGDQSQQVGNNQVVVSDVLDNLITTGMPATGNSYIGRKCIVNWGPHTEERVIIADDAGTTTTRILTVNEDWAANPVSSDTFDIAINGLIDVENGTASGGITVNAVTKEYTYTNEFNVNSGGFVQHVSQLKFEINDSQGNPAEFTVASGGRWSVGYVQDGRTINGSNAINENGIAAGADGEDSFLIEDGAIVSIFDFTLLNPVFDLQWRVAAGGVQDKTKVYFKGFKSLFLSYNPILGYGVFEDFNVTGSNNVNNYYEITADTEVLKWTMVDCAGFDTLNADTSVEIVRIDEVLWVNSAPLVTVRANKSWLVIDPADSGWVIDIGTQDQLSFPVNTSNQLEKGYSVKVTAQEPDGTLLQDAQLIVYEHTQLGDLVLEQVTDVNGYAEGYFIHEKYVYATTTTLTRTTYGGHALRIDKYGYFPFVADQSSTEKISGVFTLNTDSNVIEAVPATAITNGSGIIWNEDTNPSSVIEFTGGAGTLTVGATVVGDTSGATGVVTQIVDGDSVTGTIHLKNRSATPFSAAGESINNSGLGWTATMTAASEQEFSIWIDANSKTYQIQYDYWAARTSEVPTLNAIGEIVHEWGRGQIARALFKAGTDFYTERSNGKGIIVINGGGGTVGYFTDDNGNTWIPPITVPISVVVRDEITQALIDDAMVYMEAAAGGPLPTGTVIISPEITGIDGTVSATILAGGQPFIGLVADALGNAHVAKPISGTIPTAGLTLNVSMVPE